MRDNNISQKEKIGYGLGDTASSIFWKLFSVYLMFFYTDIIGLEAQVVGTMFLVTRIWDSLFDPLVGVVADRTRSRWGSFRPYLFYGAIPFGILAVFTFYVPAFNSTSQLVYAYVSYSLVMMVYSIINVPYASLLGVISPSPKVRSVLATYRMTFAYLGSFFVLLFFNPLIDYFSGYQSDLESQKIGWTSAAAVMAVCSVMCFFLCFYFTRERITQSNINSSTLFQDVKNLMYNKPWWILMGAGLAVLMFNSVRDGAVLYYFKYYIKEFEKENVSFFNISFALSGLYLAIGQVANILGVIVAAPISNILGKKKTFLWAMFIACIGSVFFYGLSSTNLLYVFLLQIVISIAAGVVFPLLWAMYADCADYSELNTGNRAIGLLFSTSSMSQKIGWAIGTAVTGWLLTLFGFQANEMQDPKALQGIKMFLSIFPAICCIFSILFMLFYPLDEQRMSVVSNRLSLLRSKK